MKIRTIGRGWLAVLCSIALIGAGAALVTPAASALAGINWNSAFKHEIKPRADKLYAPKPKTIRGTFDVSGDASSASEYLTSSISFGIMLKNKPKITYLHSGDSPTSACPGTVTAPKAKPGHLCVYEETVVNTSATGTYDPTTPTGLFASSNKVGITVFGLSAAAGQVFSFGSWALGVGKFSAKRSGTPRTSGPGAVR